MRILKKVFAVALCVALTLTAAPFGGFVGLDLSGLFDFNAQALEGLTTFEGSELTYTFETDIKPAPDGNIYLLPGETVKISVYMTTNYYTGTNGGELFLWTSGIFEDLGENYSVLNFASESLSQVTNPAPTGAYPSTNSTDSYSGLLVGRNNKNCSPRVLDNELVYEINLTVAEDAVIGSTATFEMPASSVRPFATPARKGVIYSAVIDSGAVVSQYAETTNVPEPLKFVVDGVVANGTCGDNVDWTLYRSGKLVISGSGEMVFADGAAPWKSYFDAGYYFTDVVIEDGITSIADYAFSDLCYYSETGESLGLKNVTIGDDITTIGDGAFKYTDIANIIIPDNVTTIGSDAFWGCGFLSMVTIGCGVTSIGSGAFGWCTNLTNVIIPDSVISIGVQAFSFCNNLAKVTIGKSVTVIDKNAFASCSSITKVYFAGTEEQWNAIGYSDWDEPAPTIYFNHPDHVAGEWK